MNPFGERGTGIGLLLAGVLAIGFLLGAAYRAQKDSAWADDVEKAPDRADLNSDGSTDVSDAVFLLRFLFEGGPSPEPCTSGATTTAIITRHAEKESGADPSLTEEGQLRAEQFGTILANIEADLLVTSELRRTIETLLPLAEAQGKTEEDLVKLETADQVIKLVEGAAPGSTIVIAHHSFTIPSILDKLGVTGHEEISIGGSNYDNWFLIQLPEGSPAQFHHFKYAPLEPAKKP